jgi:hypothetical protein
MRALHLEALEKLTGVRHVVLDFIETGGIPPSVEALYAWLEYRCVSHAGLCEFLDFFIWYKILA